MTSQKLNTLEILLKNLCFFKTDGLVLICWESEFGFYKLFQEQWGVVRKPGEWFLSETVRIVPDPRNRF